MKAIQIKYLPATNTLGARLKAFTEAGAITESVNYSANLNNQAFALAERYVEAKGWNVISAGFGQLPNGDYVYTLGL